MKQQLIKNPSSYYSTIVVCLHYITVSTVCSVISTTTVLALGPYLYRCWSFSCACHDLLSIVSVGFLYRSHLLGFSMGCIRGGKIYSIPVVFLSRSYLWRMPSSGITQDYPSAALSRFFGHTWWDHLWVVSVGTILQVYRWWLFFRSSRSVVAVSIIIRFFVGNLLSVVSESQGFLLVVSISINVLVLLVPVNWFFFGPTGTW